MQTLIPVTLYTDGACKGNPGPGGWGALLIAGTVEKELFGGALNTTNNQMELTAVIEGLQAIKRPCAVTLYLDSEYVRKGITEWIVNWQRRGWKTADGKPVKNADLWQRLDSLRKLHTVEWRWVKGHAGDPGNERDGVFRAREWRGDLALITTLPYDPAVVRANDGKCDALGRYSGFAPPDSTVVVTAAPYGGMWNHAHFGVGKEGLRVSAWHGPNNQRARKPGRPGEPEPVGRH